MRLLSCIPFWLAAATAAAAPLPDRQDPPNDRRSTSDEALVARDYHEFVNSVVQGAAWGAGVTTAAWGLQRAVNGARNKRLQRPRMSELFPVDPMEDRIKPAIRKITGQWADWDRNDCLRRRHRALLAATGWTFPNPETLERWKELCNTRETADIPFVGEPIYMDEHWREISKEEAMARFPDGMYPHRKKGTEENQPRTDDRLTMEMGKVGKDLGRHVQTFAAAAIATRPKVAPVVKVPVIL